VSVVNLDVTKNPHSPILIADIVTKYQPASKDFEARIVNVVLKDLERENKLPPGYLMALRDADADWDFIVKLSLVLEALLTRAILHEAGPSLTYESVSRESQSKRLQTAKRLGLIDKAERKMLVSISEIRNDFVHQIENLTRPLTEYFEELKPARQEHIAKSILGVEIPGKLGKTNDQSAFDQFPQNFRHIAMRALFPTLLKLGYSHDIKQREKKYSDWRADQERRLGRPLPQRTEFYLADRLMVLELVATETPTR
jgi:hypothetical protein